MSWVKFHDEIRRGSKRGLSRATRFIFLELCLEARPGRGVIPLPVGMSDVDGVCEILGGNSREVRTGLPSLLAGSSPMLRFDGEPGLRSLVIDSWARWNSSGETAGASTERSRRARKSTQVNNTEDDATACNDRCVPLQTVAPDQVQRDATVPRVEKSREEKRERESADSDAGASSAPAPSEPKTRKRPATPCPLSSAPDAEVSAWLTRWGIPGSHYEATKFLDYHRSKGSMFADWGAAWRTWLRNAERFSGGGGNVALFDDAEAAERERLGKAPSRPEVARPPPAPWDGLDGTARRLWGTQGAYEAACFPKVAK